MGSERLLSPAIRACTPGPGQLSGNMHFCLQGGSEGGRVSVDLCKSITMNDRAALTFTPGGQIRGALFTIGGQQVALLGH